MDNPVDHVDNWREAFDIIARGFPSDLKLFACGVIFLVIVQAFIWARSEPEQVHTHLAAPISRFDVLALVWLAFLVHTAFGVSDNEARNQLRDLQRDVDHIAMDVRELRAQNKCKESP